MIVKMEAIIYATEDVSRVERAITNLLVNHSFERAGREDGATILTAISHGDEALARFREMLRRQRIRGAARSILLRGVGDRSLVFYLNKQAAFVDRVSFSGATEDPLGPIMVGVTCDSPTQLVDWLAPET